MKILKRLKQPCRHTLYKPPKKIVIRETLRNLLDRLEISGEMYAVALINFHKHKRRYGG